eukprot:7848983-Lingulodinium_polyedra.AAC.1
MVLSRHLGHAQNLHPRRETVSTPPVAKVTCDCISFSRTRVDYRWGAAGSTVVKPSCHNT